MKNISIQAGTSASIQIGDNSVGIPEINNPAYWVVVISRQDASVVLNNAYLFGKQDEIAKDLESCNDGNILCVASVNLEKGALPHSEFEKIIVESGGGQKLDELEDLCDVDGLPCSPDLSYAFAGTMVSRDDGFEAISTDAKAPAIINVDLLSVPFGEKQLLTTVQMQVSNANKPAFV